MAGRRWRAFIEDMRMITSENQPELVIVGAGIAGAALAIVLARAGLQVVVLELQREYRDRGRGEYWANW